MRAVADQLFAAAGIKLIEQSSPKSLISTSRAGSWDGRGHCQGEVIITHAIIIPAGIIHTLTHTHIESLKRNAVKIMAKRTAWCEAVTNAGGRQLGSDKVKSTHAIETGRAEAARTRKEGKCSKGNR